MFDLEKRREDPLAVMGGFIDENIDTGEERKKLNLAYAKALIAKEKQKSSSEGGADKNPETQKQPTEVDATQGEVKDLYQKLFGRAHTNNSELVEEPLYFGA